MENIQISLGADTRAGISSWRSWLGDRKGNPWTLAGCCRSAGSSALRAFWEVCSSFHGFALICWQAAAAPEDTGGSGNLLHGDQGSRSPCACVPAFQMEFPLLPFLTFLSQQMAQPLLQNPPRVSPKVVPIPKAFPRLLWPRCYLLECCVLPSLSPCRPHSIILLPPGNHCA